MNAPRRWFTRWLAHARPWGLWFVLASVVLSLLATLVWLARDYEIEQLRRTLERDSADAAQHLRQHLARNTQDLHRLGSDFDDPIAWWQAARQLLDERREWVRLHWRGPGAEVVAVADSPYYPALDAAGIAHAQGLDEACEQALAQGAAMYAPSRYLHRTGNASLEVMDVCLPIAQGGRFKGYVVATYTLQGLLGRLPESFTRGQSLSLLDADGARLVNLGLARRGARAFVANQWLNLPGAPMVLRLEGARQLPDLLPNVLTALVTGLSIALISVLALLARDFRARQQAEHQLAEALAFRKAMEDSLSTGLRARDLQGRITYVNPAFCQMVGLPASALIGQSSPAPYWPPELAPEYARNQARKLGGAEGGDLRQEGQESVFMRQDGTRFPVLIFEAPLMSADGRHTGWMSAIMDMSAQRRAEELSRASQDRLQASARLASVGEMASFMSHELNQPLAAIASYATGSLNLLAQPPAAADWQDLRLALTRIAEQAERAGRVIQSVRDLARPRSSQRAAVAPQELLQTVLPLVQLQARQLQAQVHVSAPADLPRVWCEATMIEQVLLNLARNGLQACAPTAGPHHIRLQAALSADGAAVEFAVSDSGQGITPEVARQLFTPFFTTKTEGTGLGLSLCRTVVEQHGSTLWHRPHSPRGTVFGFSLTLART